MVGFLKSRAFAIGVDIEDDSVKLAQLTSNVKGVGLIAGRSKSCPESVKTGSAAWQRWVVEAIREATVNHGFRGRNVVAAIPASAVFIEHVKVGTQFYSKSNDSSKQLKSNDEKLIKFILSKIKQKLPFEPNDAMIQFIPTYEDNVLVMATERKIIDRHLAIYEKAGLTIKSIGAWPVALATCYTRFFSRRKDDLEAVVMLLDVQTNYTNMVICRHKNPLFACSIPIGAKQLEDETIVTRLIFELTTCRRRFTSMYRNAHIERLIFLSGPAVDDNTYTSIAKQMEIQAQVGDCMAAIEIDNHYCSGVDRRNGDANINWATAFGLSLSIS